MTEKRILDFYASLLEATGRKGTKEEGIKYITDTYMGYLRELGIADCWGEAISDDLFLVLSNGNVHGFSKKFKGLFRNGIPALLSDRNAVGLNIRILGTKNTITSIKCTIHFVFGTRELEFIPVRSNVNKKKLEAIVKSGASIPKTLKKTIHYTSYTDYRYYKDIYKAS